MEQRRIADGLRARLASDQTDVRGYVEAALQRLEADVRPPPARDVAPEAIAALIDHTALKPQTKGADVRRLCEEARRYGFAAVCVNPCYVELAAADVEGTDVQVCTVVGFPLGATLAAAKAAEARLAIEAGADEVDMVLNVGLLKSGRYGDVEADVRAVVEAARRTSKGALVKVILETALLDDEEKALACVVAQAAGADFVKTSTGFSTGGATLADVALMRHVVGEKMGVKASGGIRSMGDARAMVERGATRLGASASVAIIGGEGGTVSAAATY